MKADIDELVADYRDDALFVAPSGTKTGRDGVRQAFQELLALVPDAKWETYPSSSSPTTCCSSSGVRDPPNLTSPLVSIPSFSVMV